MNLFRIIIITAVSTIVALVGMLTWSVEAASPTPQPTSALPTYLSVSGLAFLPLDNQTNYRKDSTQQLLSTLPAEGSAMFVAPLAVTGQIRLTEISMFGDDNDPQGEVRLRLKRCSLGQPLCVVLGETTSTVAYMAGRFETNPIVINEQVDPYLYTYLLEAELSAGGNSGLRGVRLTTITTADSSVSASGTWALSGSIISYQIPTHTLSQVRVCTGDLSHLNNVTHYPYLLVDGEQYSFTSQSCVLTWGSRFELRRELNTGDSAGTYEILNTRQ